MSDVENSTDNDSKHEKMSVGHDGHFFFLGHPINYEDLPDLFRNNATNLRLDMDSAKINLGYELCIKGNTYCYEILRDRAHDSMISYLLKNNELHCDLGPAIVSPSFKAYCSNDKLHNLNGPAIEFNSGKKIYAIDGIIYKFPDYIYNHPKASKIHVIDKGYLVSKSRLNNLVSFKRGATTVLVNEDAAPITTTGQNFLLSCIFRAKMNGVVEFETTDKDIKYLYGALGGPEKNWSELENDLCRKLVYDNGIIRTNLELDKVKNTLRCELYSSGKFYGDGKIDEFTIYLDNAETDVHHINLQHSKYKNGETQGSNKLYSSWSAQELEARDQEFKTRKQEVDKILDYVSVQISKNLNKSIGSKSNLDDGTIDVYGRPIPAHMCKDMKYDVSTRYCYWENKEGALHSPGERSPSVITPDGDLFFHQNGFLHHESLPAMIGVKIGGQRWFLWGHEVSKEELDHYDPKSKSIVFKNEAGRYHRSLGPAVIQFDAENRKISKYFNNGIENFPEESASPTVSKISPIIKKKKPKVVKVTTKSNTKLYTELTDDEVASIKSIFRDHIDHLKKFEPEIREAARKALINKGLPPDYLDKKPEPPKVEEKTQEPAKGDDREMETRKNIRSAPEADGTRKEQLVSGFKFGFKKGVVNNASKIVAEKLVALTPLADNALLERFVQVCFLLGSAEMLERMPDGMAEKMRMSEEFRLNSASMLRYVSGDNIGRDLVDFAADILPVFAELVANMSAEELADLTADLETQATEDSEEAEDLFTPASVEEEVVVKEQQYAEVGKR